MIDFFENLILLSCPHLKRQPRQNPSSEEEMLLTCHTNAVVIKLDNIVSEYAYYFNV